MTKAQPETELDPSKFGPQKNNKSNSPGSLINSSNSFDDNKSNAPIKSDLKSQTVTNGVLLPKNGQSITVQPITLDSIAALASSANSANAVMAQPLNDNANSVPEINPSGGRTKIVNNNVGAPKETYVQKIDLSRNNNAYAPNNSIAGVKYNFYVSQNGKYAITFFTRDFYLNLSETGQLSDLSVVQSGRISNASISRVSRVGNLNVTYNDKGQINAINDVAIDYTNENKVAKIGDIPVSYMYDGFIDKVGDVKIYYNTNGTVYLIDKFKVTYNYDGLVNGIDDSKGLIIYKTQIK